MIIVNQNKDEFVNFENIMCVNITDCQEDGFLISAGFIIGRDDNYRELGYYKTEERAKEVLKEITKAHASFEIIKNSNTEIKKILLEILEKDFKYFDTYEMPKE